MKKLLLILTFTTSCFAATNTMPKHIKPIAADYHNYVSTVCVNGVEYVMAATNNGVGITPSLQSFTGMIKKCDY